MGLNSDCKVNLWRILKLPELQLTNVRTRVCSEHKTRVMNTISVLSSHFKAATFSFARGLQFCVRSMYMN